MIRLSDPAPEGLNGLLPCDAATYQSRAKPGPCRADTVIMQCAEIGEMHRLPPVQPTKDGCISRNQVRPAWARKPRDAQAEDHAWRLPNQEVA